MIKYMYEIKYDPSLKLRNKERSKLKSEI